MRYVPVLLLAASFSTAALARPDCRNWMDSRFWEQATENDVRSCLNESADSAARDVKGATPLHYAVAHGRAEVVRALSGAGADFGARDQNGWTPMHFAASTGDAENLQTLTEFGADIEARDELG